ncbi:MAG: nitroreductase family protein [Bacteroidales bacterium]
MELYEGIISRRSIRNYTGEIVDEEIIRSIIKAGMYAPSARNKRPWHFIVIDDRSVMKQIMDVHPYSSMLAQASHAIVVCGDKNLENGPGYYKLDCSAASQNILLASHSKGLGAVWLGVEPREERIKAISNILGLPSNIAPVSIISIGIPARRNTGIPDRFEEKKIRRNKW